MQAAFFRYNPFLLCSHDIARQGAPLSVLVLGAALLFLFAAMTQFEGYEPRQQRRRIKLANDALDVA